MRFSLFIIILSNFLTSCGSNTEYLKEVNSEKMVKMVNESSANNSDSLNILIPLEFQLPSDRAKIKRMQLYYMVDGKIQNQIDDYVVMNGETDRKIYGIEELKIYPKSIYLLQRNYFISKEYGNRILKKYNKENVADIQSGDTINVTSYQQFRKDFPEFVQVLRKKTDSAFFRINIDKELIRDEKKIKW